MASADNYDSEDWLRLYQMAVLELEHAKMAGRIGDARAEIAARIEKLRDLPGLHADERQAIEDALDALRSVERIEERDEENERRIAKIAIEKLRAIAPKLEKP